MKDSIRNHVTKYLEKEEVAVTDENIIEVIRDGKHVWTGDYDSHRWWNECFTVVDVDGLLIGFGDAETTGDDSPYDKGWEFDPDSICEVEAQTETITRTVYKAKE